MKWNVDDYVKNASFVSQYGEDVLALLKPMKGEAILDLGCGDGALAEKMTRKGCKVTAIDSSDSMIERAQKRGVDAYLMRAEEMNFDNQFHAVFSNAALHWMKESDRVIQNVFKSLTSNGRFCAEMGGSGNVQTIVSQIYKELEHRGLNGDAYNPWYFPSKEQYAQQLEQAGFTIDFIDQFDRPTKLPTDIAGWLKTFAQPFLRDIPQGESEIFIQAIKDGVAGILTDHNGGWYADYVRLRFHAVKEEA